MLSLFWSWESPYLTVHFLVICLLLLTAHGASKKNAKKEFNWGADLRQQELILNLSYWFMKLLLNSDLGFLWILHPPFSSFNSGPTCLLRTSHLSQKKSPLSFPIVLSIVGWCIVSEVLVCLVSNSDLGKCSKLPQRGITLMQRCKIKGIALA